MFTIDFHFGNNKFTEYVNSHQKLYTVFWTESTDWICNFAFTNALYQYFMYLNYPFSIYIKLYIINLLDMSSSKKIINILNESCYIIDIIDGV